MTATNAWLAFAACAGTIAIAGTVLCREADAIAEATGLSRSWIGLVLLAAVTSLPELITGVSAAIARLPDIAVGDALGSCIANFAILGAMYLFAGDRLRTLSWRGPRKMALLGAALVAIPAVVLAVGGRASGLDLGRVGAYSPLILAAYIAAMWIAFGREREPAERAPGRRPALRGPLLRYGMAATVVAVSGAVLPYVAAELAERMDWTHSFVGTLFVGATTSLPELAVTITAVRMGAFEMAIGNLLGSNLFDIAILAIDDLAFAAGPILAHVSPALAPAAAAAVVMGAVAVIRPSRGAGVLLVGLYLATLVLVARA